MGYHILLGKTHDFTQLRQLADAKECPFPDFFILQEQLDATIYCPDSSVPIQIWDRIGGIIESKPANWALARSLASRLTEQDIVLCDSENSSIPLAAMFYGKKKRPRIASMFYNFVRPRGLLSTKLFRVAQTIDLFFVTTEFQGKMLHEYLKIPKERIHFIWHKIDLNFFTPGPSSGQYQRPLLASVGVETRDYRLVASAIQDMDVDVRICAVSEYAKRFKRSFPDVIPPNMICQYYSIKDLVQLYRDANIVLVSTFESPQGAGATSLIEAMACKRPIIATNTKSLSTYLDKDAMLIVEPGDVEGMKRAIQYLLEHPNQANQLAEKGYHIAKERHSSEHFVQTIISYLKDI